MELAKSFATDDLLVNALVLNLNMNQACCENYGQYELTPKTQLLVNLIEQRHYWKGYFFRVCFGLEMALIVYTALHDKSENMITNVVLKALFTVVSTTLEIIRTYQNRSKDLSIFIKF